MERVAILEGNVVVNVVKAPARWEDPSGRETILAPMGSGIEIGAKRKENGSFEFLEPRLSEEEARKKRDTILVESVDPIVSNPLRWGNMTPEQQQAWKDYRQALLDVPQQDGFPEDVAWPDRPAG